MPAMQTTKNIIVTAVSVGVASAQAIGVNLQRARLMIQNASASASIAICPTSFGAAALNTAGSITLAPGAVLILDGDAQTFDAFNAIASAATTPMTVWEF